MRAAIVDLNRRGIGVAAMLIDSIFSSDGVWVDPPGFIAGGVAAVREAGGLVIADEVQPGFGRTGAHMWGFERHGIVPDLVTLGKPMGNGFPIGAVVGRRSPMDRFGDIARYSNTFAGNTMGIATADAVLTILQRDHDPPERACHGPAPPGRAGEARKAACWHSCDPQCRSLLWRRYGVQRAQPRQAGVPWLWMWSTQCGTTACLISTTGANEDTLKVRPPLVCQAEHVDLFLASIERALIKVAC